MNAIIKLFRAVSNDEFEDWEEFEGLQESPEAMEASFGARTPRRAA